MNNEFYHRVIRENSIQKSKASIYQCFQINRGQPVVVGLDEGNLQLSKLAFINNERPAHRFVFRMFSVWSSEDLQMHNLRNIYTKLPSTLLDSIKIFEEPFSEMSNWK